MNLFGGFLVLIVLHHYPRDESLKMKITPREKNVCIVSIMDRNFIRMDRPKITTS